MSWLAAHLHYHADPALVVRDVVDPVVRARGHSLSRWFFVRYWNGGPHVRLRMWLADEQDRATASAEVEQRFRALIERQPSQAGLDQAEYAQVAGALGAVESEPVCPLQPDNSLTWQTYQPEVDRYGGPAAMAAVEEFFTSSSVEALADLAANRLAIERALWCMATGLAAISDTAWSARFVAHSVALWRGWRDGPDWSAMVARAWRSAGEDVRKLVGQAVAGYPDGTRWSAACQRLQERLAALEAAGSIRPVLPPGVAPDDLNHLDRGLVTWFALHMHNNRLGVHMEREALAMEMLNLALSETVEVTS